MSAAQLLCSVIIVTWNRRRELAAALDSVFRQTVAGSLEVIVIDNASTDGTAEWLTRQYPHPVRVFAYRENRGASCGRNAGIRLARAPHVCFLDSDAEILTPDAIERCLDFLRAHSGVRAVSGPIWFDREKTRPFSLGCYITPEGHYCGPRTRSDTEDPHFLSTCFAVWDKALLKELRGFDPWYFWGIEDLDIALRAYHAARRGKRRGATRFAIIPGAETLHEMSRTGRHYQPDDFHKVFHAYERQRLRLVLAYGGPREFFRVLLRTPFALPRVEREAWEQPLRLRYRVWALVVYPLMRLAKLPFDLPGTRRDFLAETPLPREVKHRRQDSVE